MSRALLIGAGSSRDKRLSLDGKGSWDELVTLDYNPDHGCDICWNLNAFPYPLEDNSFDEIHAYEVLEHCGHQGDYRFFFKQFDEFYRILKPGGHFLATCPSPTSVWAWGDPSHTRVLQKENLIFLDQSEYEKQVGVTPMSDFRNIYKSNFRTVAFQDDGETFWFILKSMKEQ